MCRLIFFFAGLFLMGCGKKELKRTWSYDMLGDTLYEVDWFNGAPEGEVELALQLYISSVGDTIVNQFYYYTKEGIIDTLKSEFYSLQIIPSDTLHRYKGVLVLHTRFDTLRVNEKNRRKLQLLYDEFTDSLLLGSVISERSNRLEFYYRNTIDHHLTGVLLQDVFRDTIVGQDTLLNYGKTRLLVDTRTSTNNTFIKSHRFLKVKRLGYKGSYFLE